MLLVRRTRAVTGPPDKQYPLANRRNRRLRVHGDPLMRRLAPGLVGPPKSTLARHGNHKGDKQVGSNYRPIEAILFDVFLPNNVSESSQIEIISGSI